MTKGKCIVDHTTLLIMPNRGKTLAQIEVLFAIALGVLVGAIGMYALFSNGNGGGDK